MKRARIPIDLEGENSLYLLARVQLIETCAAAFGTTFIVLKRYPQSGSESMKTAGESFDGCIPGIFGCSDASGANRSVVSASPST